MTLARFKIPIVEYPPMQIKLAVTGSGKAEKKEVIDEAKGILDVKKVIASISLVKDLRIQKD